MDTLVKCSPRRRHHAQRDFYVNALRGKLHQLGSPNLQDRMVRFSGTEISLILKNKMAAVGISLKIIYLFLLAGSRR